MYRPASMSRGYDPRTAAVVVVVAEVAVAVAVVMTIVEAVIESTMLVVLTM